MNTDSNSKRSSSRRQTVERQNEVNEVKQYEQEIKREQIRSKKLQKIREEELRIFNEEAIELSRLVDIYEEESLEENQSVETQSIGPAVPVDQSFQIPPPLVDPDGLLSFGGRNLGGRERSVSTGVNRVEWGKSESSLTREKLINPECWDWECPPHRRGTSLSSRHFWTKSRNN